MIRAPSLLAIIDRYLLLLILKSWFLHAHYFQYAILKIFFDDDDCFISVISYKRTRFCDWIMGFWYHIKCYLCGNELRKNDDFILHLFLSLALMCLAFDAIFLSKNPEFIYLFRFGWLCRKMEVTSK